MLAHERLDFCAMLPRMNTHLRSIAMLVVILLGAATDARAQEVAGTFDQLRVLVKAGDTISVTDNAGRELTGKIAELSSTSLALLVGGQRHDLPAAEVNTIRQRRGDPLANGAKWGFGIGATLGLLGGLAVANESDDDSDAAFVVFGTLFYAGVGAGIGAGLDALIASRQVIYARRSSASARLTLKPFATRRRQGAMVAIAF